MQFVLGARGETGAAHLHAQEWTVPGKAMQHLAPAIEHALCRLGASPEAVTAVACVRGPGSFTGLRLTLATAIGLSRALGIPLAGMDYLPLLAAAPAATCSGGSLWVLTHARREQVYVQGFVPAPDSLMPESMGPAQSAHLSELPGLLAQAPLPTRLLGSGVRRNLAGLNALLAGPDAPLVLPPHLDHPAPSLLLACAASLPLSLEPIEPLYIRASDAEENLADIARGRGLSLDQARHILDSSTD